MNPDGRPEFPRPDENRRRFDTPISLKNDTKLQMFFEVVDVLLK